MSAEAPVLPGETLADKYRVERILGRGGMGVVVAARHLALDERVAIKFLSGEAAEDAVERFLREARAAAKVKGEHVCRVFDFGRLDTGEPYIVMEHLEGTDLARKLEREGAQPPEAAVGWVIEACDALADAHALGIVHRDLKPANIFLANRPDGSACAKVLDFGISKLASSTTMTRTSAVMGSPAYMSPEQVESSRDVDARSDVWSLGVVLYELLSGRPPFAAESMVQLAVKIREKEPPPLEELRPELPEALRAVIARCLAKAREDRYGGVEALVAALAPFAPPQVAGIVARRARAAAARSAEELALAETKRAEAPGTSAAAGGGTLDPLETERTRARKVARWPLALAALGVAALGALALRAPAERADASSSGSSAPSTASIAPSAAPPASTAAVAAEPVAPAASSAAASPAEAAPPPRPRAPALGGPAQATRAAPPVSAAAATASAPASAAPPPGPPHGPKKREIDRDDP